MSNFNNDKPQNHNDTTEHNQGSYCSDRDMKALLDMTRALGVACQLDSLLEMVVSCAMKLLRAERATLFLYDAQKEELYTRIAANVEGFRISINTGIAGVAARTMQTVNIPDAYKDDRFNRSVDDRTGYKTRSILACPLRDYDGRLVGVLQVLNKCKGSFNQHDIDLAEALSAQAGVAIQRTYLLNEYLEKKRLEQAMETAREIQQHLMPSAAPPLNGFDITCWNRPCDQTGGDYSDFMLLNDNRMMITLGDVTGHGVGPALISSSIRAMLRAMCSLNMSIPEVMSRVNNLMTNDMPGGRFVTVFLGTLNAETSCLTYCSAGQGPLLWYRADSDTIQKKGARNIPIGIIPDWTMISDEIPGTKPDNTSTKTTARTSGKISGTTPDELTDTQSGVIIENIVMNSGDIFVLLTDGFYEWKGDDGKLFGTERVCKIIQQNKGLNATDILSAIRNAVENFSGEHQDDDLTAIIIKKL